MSRIKILCRIAEFDDAYLPDFEALVEKAGGAFLRIKTIPDGEHWLEYHCRFRKKVKGLRKFARQVVQLDQMVVAERKKENAKRIAQGMELLPDIEPLPVGWPNEERRAVAGAMLEEFMEQGSSIRHDLQAPKGSYERDIALDKVKGLLERMKWELQKGYEDAEERSE